jgi:cell division septum initiation protein DivIVA
VEMSPQHVRSAEFKTVRKGADLEEVRLFLNDVADELERAQNQSAAMEARARAAVARLQELNDGAAAPKVDASAEEAETISRTLLLAQRTADTTLAEARFEAARIVAEANDEAARTLDSTREMSAQLIDEARVEARRVGQTERQHVAGEVEALKARRDFLESDVHHLETFLVDQRARLREAASSLIDVVDRVPGGLGEVRAPLLSAADDDEAGVSGQQRDEGSDSLLIVTDVAESTAADQQAARVGLDSNPWAEDTADTADTSGTADTSDTSGTADTADTAGEPTEAIAVFGLDTGDSSAPTSDDDTEFRFSFDDERS